MAKHIENFGEYSVKNVKSFMGMDTMGYNANLYRDKKKVATCVDDGGGGEVRIDWLAHEFPSDLHDRSATDQWHRDRNAERVLLDSHCASLPPLNSGYAGCGDLTVDAELFVSELVLKFEVERDINKMRKVCQVKTLFRESNAGHGAYRIIKTPCDDRVRQHIRTRYGNDVEIFNDVFAQGGVPSVLQNND